MARTRSFPCSWDACEKVFNRKSDLCRHFRIHTNERPYCCDFPDCNKSFIQRSALTVHTRTHTGEKPHVCDIADCRKAFSDSSSLARHRRIHTGKRPYRCQEPTCDRSFCRKTTLTKHQHRSHQTDVPSTPSSIRSQDFQPPALSPMPQPQQIQMKQEISEPNLTPYQAPMAIPQSYPPQPQLPPQIQQHMQQQQFPPSNQQQLQHVIQCISSHPEPVPISHTETTYVGCGLVMPPQHERFEAYIPRDTIPQTDTKYIPTAAIQGPNYMSMYQVPYQPDISQEFKQEFKPMQSRIFDPYQSRGAWGFLGSEG